MPIQRRTLLATASALLAGAAPDPIAAIERAHGGRLAVFAQDTASGRTLSHRATERVLMASTFKGLLAGQVLARIDAGQDSLTANVPYTARDLLPNSPVTAAHIAAGALPVGTLCQAMLERSDNAAANLLLARTGGPASLTAYLRRLGDTTTRVDRYEVIHGWSGLMDTTTPQAIVTDARTLLTGSALTPASRTLLAGWMAANVPGRTRLRAAFPANWRAADRTGTADGICNDYAMATPPGRAPLFIACYYDAPGMTMEAQEAVLRDVGAAFVAWA